MPKRSHEKTPIAEQDPKVRQHNFDEVVLGYTMDEGVLEANRCLQCTDKPCVQGCPVNIDIPEFIKDIKEGNMDAARKTIAKYSNLPAVCGRVCPQEKQCEMVCTLGKNKKYEPVSIGKLERLVADWGLDHPEEPKEVPHDKGKVAVVGAGPSGLTVAGDLAKAGYAVTVFEALSAAGGVLTYGIPEFRLPKATVKKQVAEIAATGVDFETDMVVGKTITMDEIMDQFDACYIGVGAGAPNFMNIPGTELNGVYSSSEYLTRINLMHGYKPGYDTPVDDAHNVVVIGGGNVAMDCARSAKRLGADKVTVCYRRTEEELPARVEEYHHSLAEDIDYSWLTSPVAYLGDEDGNLTGIKCIKMQLGEPDDSGRRRPEPIEGSEFTIPCTSAIEAIGQGANKVLLDAYPELKTNKWGYIDADESTCKTSIPGVYAGGDIVTGAATVILAMGAGKIAAKEIDEYIQNKVKA